MPRKKKEETAEEVKVTTTRSKKTAENKSTTTKCSKFGFAELQNKAKLHVKGLRDTVR